MNPIQQQLYEKIDLVSRIWITVKCSELFWLWSEMYYKGREKESSKLFKLIQETNIYLRGYRNGLSAALEYDDANHSHVARELLEIMTKVDSTFIGFSSQQEILSK